MTNLIDNGAAWLMGQLKTHASRPVVYRRGAAEIACSAVPSRSEFTVEDPNGATVLVESADWIFSYPDLVLAGEALVPRRGDEIEETAGDGTRRTFQVLELSGVQPFKVDAARASIRVHCKLKERRDP